MAESLKLAEMQRTSIEFERQRHLANWLIKSSPHMATPPANMTTVNTNSTTTAPTTSGLTTGAQQNYTATTTTPSTQNSGAIAITTTTTGIACNDDNSGNGTSGISSKRTIVNLQQHQQHQHKSLQQQQQQQQQHQHQQMSTKSSINGHTNISANTTPVFFLMSSNGGAVSSTTPAVSKPKPQSARSTALGGTNGLGHLGHGAEARKPKLRRFNSHDTSSNMFSVADFENARLARRNEIELKQRLARRQRNSANSSYGMGSGSGYTSGGMAGGIISSTNGYGGGFCGGVNTSGGGSCGDYSTGDSKASKYSNESQTEPLPAEIFLDRFQLPRVVRISYKTKFSDETLQSSSSNGSSTVTSSSSASAGNAQPVLHNASNGHAHSSDTTTSSSTASSSACGQANLNSIHNNITNHNNININTNNNNGNGTNGSSGSASSASSNKQLQSLGAGANIVNAAAHAYDQHSNGELFLLYRLIRQRHVYHGHNAKTAANNRKKGVLIPQEFPGYFSLINEKGLPTATQYTSLIQLVRERVYKFVSVDNMPAFTESQPNTNSPPNEGCLPIYTTQPPNSNRPHYIKTTARGGQVFRLLAVFEDGKQDHNAIAGNLSGGVIGSGAGVGGGSGGKSNSHHHGREKEKGRYAQLLNENRQVLYVSLSTKGKFYEIEPGIPQILQKLGGLQNDAHKKVNPECVHRINALVTPDRVLPLTLRYVSGPNGCANAISENICITKITTENVIIACPIEDVEVQSPLHLRKLHLTKEMNLIKSYMGFESEQRMLANPNVQNILKYCQFNCDQFLKLVEIEVFNRSERSGSKSRVDGLKILKPLHLPKLLRREKTTIAAHEKEDSIIFLSKTDLANLEAKEAAAASAAAATTSAATANEHQHAHANRITEKMKVFQSTKKKWFKKQDKQSVNSLTSLELDMQAKRMSMERYTDMSKLLQERFGDKPNTSQERESISEPSSASDNGCSDTETTTLATIEQKLPKSNKSLDMLLQKSMSLQDIELMSSQRKPDLLTAHNTTADTISEAGTELDDLENQAPAQSFITEKLYTEFHVKTRQYSKSSSSLHQLFNFSLPQKMQLHERERERERERECEREKRHLAQLKQQPINKSNEPITGRRAAGGLSLLGGGFQQQISSLQSPVPSLIEDDLPYSSVRDSLVLSSDDSPIDENGGNICQALNMIEYTKENIYAEICHEASVMGGIPSSATHDTSYSGDTHSTQVSNRSTICSAGGGGGGDDDYGDYASLCYPSVAAGSTGAPHLGNAISRVQINCSASPVSYHTVYFGDEALGERHLEQRRYGRDRQRERDRAHVTTVELAGGGGIDAGTAVGVAADTAPVQSVDNIYNTLK